jgi:hypothetical protein
MRPNLGSARPLDQACPGGRRVAVCNWLDEGPVPQRDVGRSGQLALAVSGSHIRD